MRVLMLRGRSLIHLGLRAHIDLLVQRVERERVAVALADVIGILRAPVLDSSRRLVIRQ